jgi:hypothetical protein
LVLADDELFELEEGVWHARKITSFYHSALALALVDRGANSPARNL